MKINLFSRHPFARPIFGILITLTAFAISSNAIPPLITTIAVELGINYDSFGPVIMLQFVCFAIAGTVGGWISKRHGVCSRTLVLTGLLLVAITLATGATLHTMWWFIIWAVPLGFGGGLIETFGSIMISNYEAPNSSKLLNLSQVFYCIGAISAPQFVSWILHLQMPWRGAFIVFGSTALIIAIIFMRLTYNTPKPQCIDDYPKEIEHSAGMPLLKDSLYFLLAATLFLYVTCESMIVCWVSAYFEKYLATPAHAAPMRLSIYWIGLILGRLTITVIPKSWTLWPAMILGISIMLIANILIGLTNSQLIATLLVFASGLGSGPIWPTTVAICHAARNNTQFTSTVIAIGALGVAAGAAVGSITIKYIGLPAFFLAVSVVVVLLLITTCLARFSHSSNKKCRSETVMS
jgi:fucose permease